MEDRQPPSKSPTSGPRVWVVTRLSDCSQSLAFLRLPSTTQLRTGGSPQSGHLVDLISSRIICF